MHLFGLEGSGFAISLVLTVLVAGLLTYYINSRLAVVDRLIQKQNQVITSLIGGVRGDLVGGELRAAQDPPLGGAASPQAGAAVCQAPGPWGRDNVRLSVSDDDDNSNGGDDQSDSSAESDTSSENSDCGGACGRCPVEQGVRVVNLGEDLCGVVRVDDASPTARASASASEASVFAEDEGEQGACGTETDSCLSEIDVEAIVNAHSDDDPTIAAPSPQDETQPGLCDAGEPDTGVTAQGPTAGASLTAVWTEEDVAEPISSRKVSDLRSLVVAKNLMNMTEARKLRKPSLIELLQSAGAAS
jgi:hypothetical protein